VIPCAVLEDGTRVITQRGMFVALGRHKNPPVGPAAIDNRPGFLAANNLTPYISEELERSWNPIPFKLPKGSGGVRGNIAIGYNAKILPMVCHVFMDAERAGKLTKAQEHVAEMARILDKGLGVVGITALVDEATGYQEVRDRLALQEILDKFLRREFAAWAKRFPDEFYWQIFRLRGWIWKGMKVNRPQVVANYTKDLVYARLAPGILTELENRNPLNEKGGRKHKHHQWLTEDIGHPALAQHLYAVIGLMRLCKDGDWTGFKDIIDRAYPKRKDTLQLPLFAEEFEA
jgi:hypothetical protein